MIKYYFGNGNGLNESAEPKKDCWIYLELPSLEEISQISALTGIHDSFIKSALDEEEAAHLDEDGHVSMVVIDIPKMTENSNEGGGDIFTIPLAIIQNDNYFVTVCTKPTTVLNDFFQGKIKNLHTAQRHRLMYQIMYNNSVRFLYYLRQIDKASDRIQKSLQKSMQNKELLQLLDLQKSLVFFSASLTANYAVVQKLLNLNKVAQIESDILEDVVIECRQALEMCSVYREIIKNTMDAFASVVNNNQNTVMKILTVITLILSIPMLISGFWGMNTGVPFEGKLWGFWAALGISLIISICTIIIMSRKRML